MTTISLIALSVIVFATTNIDDIFVLVSFFADPALRRWHVVAGQILGIACLIGISVTAALVALAIPADEIGLLGFLPIVLGLIKLWALLRGADKSERFRRAGESHAKVLTVAAVTIGNGGDNIGVYTPLFATQTLGQSAITIAAFSVMTIVWCLVAGLIVHYPLLGKPIRRYGGFALPFVLIGLGGVILYKSGAADLLMSVLRS